MEKKSRQWAKGMTRVSCSVISCSSIDVVKDELQDYGWMSLVVCESSAVEVRASVEVRVSLCAHRAPEGNSTPSHKGIYVTIIGGIRESSKIILVRIVRVVEH